MSRLQYTDLCWRRMAEKWAALEADPARMLAYKRMHLGIDGFEELEKRAEHWVVVSGEAHVTRGDEQLVLGPDQSTYIPIGMKHRLANLGERPLEVIEVQSGSYLGEDDIVRFDDVYGREETPA